ncbi:MAG: carboxyl transferase domain-containing protein [Pseudomonadales bacterium]|nr:carboxyl transferase domain-containing protein [Pseudomonadales bacterium]
MKVLVANRGEIAIRIIRAAAELHIPTVAVSPRDDSGSLHTGKSDEAVILEGTGTAAYLDIPQLITVARESGCDAIHPGYGFLAENADFARRCTEEGLTFIGPRVDTLELFGDKARARLAATAAGVAVPLGLDHVVSPEEAAAFFDEIGGGRPRGRRSGEGRGMMIKAVGGGGGRGSRVVESADAVAATYERCRAEAQAAFGNGDLYVEEFIQRSRHVEVQILGDVHGSIAHLGERECSVQRYFQKIIEVAPAPGLADDIRAGVIDAAVRLADRVGYSNAGTFEFLVDVSATDNGKPFGEPFAFIETNARLQVEHTVTEAVTGVDIVQAQFRLAEGASIAELGLDNPQVSVPRGYAIQARVCMESIREDGSIQPSSGTLTAYEAPSGPGVRTDGFGYSGYQTSLFFDSLLAKVIGHSPSANFADAIARTTRALSEFRIEGVDTNITFLQSILAHRGFATGSIHTRFVDQEMAELATASTRHRRFVVPAAGDPSGREAPAPEDGYAGARVEDSRDPLALFNHDTQVKAQDAESDETLEPTGPVSLLAPTQGTIVSVDINEGDEVRVGQTVATIEVLELHHVVSAPRSGVVHAVSGAAGETIRKGDPIALIMEADVEGDPVESREEIDPNHIRGDLVQVAERRSYIHDDYRAEKVAKRHAKKQRSPAENIEHLFDGTFREYGPLVTAASWQKQQWLRETTQADGLVMGIGSVNGDLFDDEQSRAIVVHYDYMVVAGTQGGRGHYKQDRMYELAGRFRMPLVLFAEGGGGRPGISGGEAEPRSKTDSAIAGAAAVDLAGQGGGGVPIDSYTFTQLSELSGLVPLVGVNSGRCFAGNTVMLACCDVIIAAENSTIGLGGPAMIEGGGLGIYTPEEVGPMSFQVPNGVVDILVKDDEEAMETTKKYLSYFQGAIDNWEEHDQRGLRHIVSENRSEMYDIRDIIETLVDKDSILEIRKAFGPSIITAFIRIEGRPMGMIANNPHHLSGAIDSDASDKAARFLQLCDSFDLPVLSLMDCPGIMVGPEYERTALLRHCARMFVTGANMTTPMFGVVVRKAYGMGVRAMCGGSSLEPFFTVAWPTAEFADMSIDGRVRLTFHDELEAIEDLEERQAVYEERVAGLVDRARAVNAGGTSYGIDDVIDPVDTRAWIAQGLRSLPPVPLRTEKKRPNIDTW